MMEKLMKTEQLYEGKAKKVYATNTLNSLLLTTRMTQLLLTEKKRDNS